MFIASELRAQTPLIKAFLRFSCINDLFLFSFSTKALASLSLSLSDSISLLY